MNNWKERKIRGKEEYNTWVKEPTQESRRWWWSARGCGGRTCGRNHQRPHSRRRQYPVQTRCRTPPCRALSAVSSLVVSTPTVWVWVWVWVWCGQRKVRMEEKMSGIRRTRVLGISRNWLIFHVGFLGTTDGWIHEKMYKRREIKREEGYSWIHVAGERNTRQHGFPGGGRADIWRKTRREDSRSTSIFQIVQVVSIDEVPRMDGSDSFQSKEVSGAQNSEFLFWNRLVSLWNKYKIKRSRGCVVLLCCVAWCCIMLRCAALCCDVLRCAALCCVVLRCAALCCVVLRCAALCCVVLRCVALRCALEVMRVGWGMEIIHCSGDTWVQSSCPHTPTDACSHQWYPGGQDESPACQGSTWSWWWDRDAQKNPWPQRVQTPRWAGWRPPC